MRKTMKTMATVAVAATLALGMFAGCSNTSNETNAGSSNSVENNAVDETKDSADTESNAAANDASTDTMENDRVDVIDYEALSGSLSMAGSTSMQKMASVLQEAFMEVAPGVTVTAEFNSSSSGIEGLIGGSVDIGNASRDLKDSELEKGAVQNVVAIDGIAVIVDTANTVNNLTQEELAKIYKGEVNNWSELGGSDQAIVVVGREAGSGTRSAFEELLGVENECAYANELDSTGAVMARVASTAGAIGYVSLDVLDDSVIAVSLEGVEPTQENIKAGSYFLSRPFVMATMGEVSEQSENVQAFFQFIHSDAGKAVIEQVGLITVD